MAHRALLLTIEYPPHHGGVARYLEGMVRNLTGWQCIVYHDPSLANWRRAVFSCGRALKAVAPEVIMVSHVLPVGLSVLAARFLFRIKSPLVVFVHGMDVARPLRFWWKRFLAGCVLRRAAFVVANSEYTRGLVLRYRGIDPAKVIVVYPGVEVEESVAPPLKGVERGGELTLLTVGRLVARKGHDRFIEVLVELPQVRYVIVGDGPERGRLDRLARTEGVSDRVQFVGDISNEALPHYYQNSDAFVMLSREIDGDVEGFGIVFLEAALHRLPCIGGRGGGVPEAVVDGETGFVVDPCSTDAVVTAVRALIENSQLRLQMGAQGARRAATQFNWERTIVPLAERMQMIVESKYQLAIIKDQTTHSKKISISVIIPVYNNWREAERCLLSIARQTAQPFEVIVVDDGSEAHRQLSHETVEKREGGTLSHGHFSTVSSDSKYQMYGFDIKMIRIPHSGAAVARNRGADEARGNFLLFCDADVVMEQPMLEQMHRVLLEHPDAAFAYSSFKFGWKKFICGPFDAVRLTRHNYIHTTSLVRREHFVGFDASLKRFQDWDLWLSIVKRGARGVWIPEVLYQIKNTRGTMSRWLPAFAYRAAPWLPEVRRYKAAEEIIRRKHKFNGQLTKNN